MPHTVSYTVMHRLRINSFNELPKDKRPPRDLWSKPYRLEEFFEDVFKVDGSSEGKGKKFIEFNPEDVE